MLSIILYFIRQIPLYQNFPKPRKIFIPHTSEFSSYIFTYNKSSGISSNNYTANFRNINKYLHQYPLKPNQIYTPSPSRILSNTCAQNFRNLARKFHQNPLEFHKISILKSSKITRNLRKFTTYLFQNLPGILPKLI